MKLFKKGIFFVTILLLSGVSKSAADFRNSSVNATAFNRTLVTLNGLFNYYWKSDPINKDIKFPFACGQIGQMGTSLESQCSCSVPYQCVNCYRWWTAILMESVASYGILMNTKNHSDFPTMIFEHSPYNSDWNPAEVSGCTHIDDFLWYGIAYLRVYDWLRDTRWLHHAINLYNWCWIYGWDGECGGFIWDTCSDGKYKFNIELLEALHLVAKIASIVPNETRFLSDATRLWQWFFSYDGGYGLMTDKYLVSTGAIPLTCCNATSKQRPCMNSNSHDAIYSQGLLISASAYLYLATGNETYLKTGLRAVNAVIENYTTADGVLLDEIRGFPSYESTCTTYSDPGGDWFSFNGIFMLHLGYFTELISNNGSLPAQTLKAINLLVQRTSDSAWTSSSVWPPFDKSDVCKPGSSPLNKELKEPKFHWWWGKSRPLHPTLPSDPGYYYHMNQLRCYTLNGDDTQIWEGELKTETSCQQKCDSNVNCSKYLYQVTEDVIAGTNCWIWSYNRSNHICNLTDTNWNVGAKRPQGKASCAGKCGHDEPQKLDHGVCYCDASCSKHLDCCSDYADQCTADVPLSCKGQCDIPVSQAIPGGGYCWCIDGCNAGFTGGSCCPDYLELCLYNVGMKTCLDARSQGSALNLFLSHSIISKAMNSTF